MNMGVIQLNAMQSKSCIFTGPGDIGKRGTHNVSINKLASGDGQRNINASDPDAIWESDKIVSQPIGEERFDPREQPEYEIKYQQAVSPEDVFLQVSTLSRKVRAFSVTVKNNINFVDYR